MTGVAAVAMVSGCTVGPDFVSPASPPDQHYTSGTDPAQTQAASGTAQHFDAAFDLPADWWMLFASPELNQAVRQGLSGSPTIAIAQANLQQAKDELRSGEGMLYPQLDGGVGAAREHPSTNATPSRLHEGTFNLFTLSASVSYALDVFGGEKRAVEALGADVDYQLNAARAASLMLAANITNTYVALAASQAEIEATNEIVELEERQVHLAQVQAKAGTANYAAELALESQLQATEASLPVLRQKAARAQNLLAVLQGKTPSAWRPPQIRFADMSLPRELPLSLPAALVRQRPDVLQAEASLHGASAQVGVATAATLPSFTLTGAFGYSDTGLTSLLSPTSSAWSLGAGLTQPLFDGGTLHARRLAAVDAFNAAGANYQQTVLSAFQQVADLLRALEHDAQTLAAQDRAMISARRSLEIAQVNYASGLAGYSDVLIADAQYHQAHIADIQANAARYQDTAALFVALGGGWWNQNQAQSDKDH